MAEAIIRVIWGAHKGKSFADAPGREHGWQNQIGIEPKIFLCEAPENPHDLYSALTNCVDEVLKSGAQLFGYEIAVRDVNLLCWLTLLKQSGALLHPVFAPIFRTEQRELSLLEGFSARESKNARFSRYEVVMEVIPIT